MKTFNLEEGMPTVSDAGKHLAKIIRESKSNQKVIKIIHGYGSSGVGGAIKISIHKSLRKRMKSNEIAAFIPGEAISSMWDLMSGLISINI